MESELSCSCPQIWFTLRNKDNTFTAIDLSVKQLYEKTNAQKNLKRFLYTSSVFHYHHKSGQEAKLYEVA